MYKWVVCGYLVCGCFCVQLDGMERDRCNAMVVIISFEKVGFKNRVDLKKSKN